MTSPGIVIPGLWPVGDREAAALIRLRDWSRTSLGPSDLWPGSLRTAVDLALACKYPMVVLWGPDLVQIYNDAYREIMGDKHPLGMGQPTRDCWPEVWRINQPIYDRVFAGETVSFEDQLYPITPHGYLEEFYLSLCYSPLRNERSEVAGVLVTVFDTTRQVTARIRAERREAFLIELHDATQALTDPEQIVRTASRLLGEHLHADRSVYCTFEADGDTFEITSVSLRPGVPAMEGRYQLASFGETARLRFLANLPYVVGDTEVEEAGAEARAAFRGVSIRAHASVTLHKGGRLVAAVGVHQMTPRQWRTDEVDLVGIVANRCWESVERARAVADLRQQWHTFDTTLSNISDFTYIFDLHGRFTYANRALLALLQKPLDEVIGSNFFDLGYPPDLAARLQRQIAQVANTGVSVRDETPFTGPVGEERDYEYILVSVLGADGRIALVAGSTRDVTERRRSEERTRTSLIERDTLLKEIHHRVKNNLQVIVSLLSLQSGQMTDPTALTAFRDTQSRVRAIARIHETLYSSADLAQVEFGDYARVLVGDLLAFYDASPDRIQLQLNTEDMVLDIDQAIPLGLVLNELVTNALKHAFPGARSGIVEVSLCYLHESIGPGQTLDEACGLLRVRDNGVGIPAGLDFAQAASMGMYLVRILARQLHGKVELERGNGSEFCVTFPLTLSHPLPDPPVTP